MMNLDKFIKKMCYSNTANKNNIKNIPPDYAIKNMTRLYEAIYKPLVELFGDIIITSGYRCNELNAMVGGAPSSQHTDGEAMDFVIERAPVADIVFRIAIENILFDQLINEKDSWVHISESRFNNRNQILKY